MAEDSLWLGDIDVFTIFKRAVTHTWHKSIPYDKSIPHYYLFIAKRNVTKWGGGGTLLIRNFFGINFVDKRVGGYPILWPNSAKKYLMSPPNCNRLLNISLEGLLDGTK